MMEQSMSIAIRIDLKQGRGSPLSERKRAATALNRLLDTETRYWKGKSAFPFQCLNGSQSVAGITKSGTSERVRRGVRDGAQTNFSPHFLSESYGGGCVVATLGELTRTRIQWK